MTTELSPLAHPPAVSPLATILSLARLRALRRLGTGVLRYGLAFLLLLFGALKFAQFEAEGIKPMVENSPLMGWMYHLCSVRAVSGLIGVVELTTGLLIASRRFFPRASGYGSLAASGTFLLTLSFLATTPGVLAPGNEAGGFLMKDLILLGASLYTAAEALLAAQETSEEKA